VHPGQLGLARPRIAPGDRGPAPGGEHLLRVGVDRQAQGGLLGQVHPPDAQVDGRILHALGGQRDGVADEQPGPVAHRARALTGEPRAGGLHDVAGDRVHHRGGRQVPGRRHPVEVAHV
jgi:hypothetical protein